MVTHMITILVLLVIATLFLGIRAVVALVMMLGVMAVGGCAALLSMVM